MILRSAALALCLLAPAEGRAHSELRTSAPAQGARLAAAPTEIVLRFNELVQLTALTLIDAEGRQTRVALPRDTTPRAVERLAAPPLSPGAWRFEWRAISADGHPVRGTVRFAIEGVR
ncbi:copper resistance CopC family protein [Elioraea sp.]|uniref:copper resistance CopC family protein n=1 Tax=Elioraea sp. TaxID=2185103 RepID=UPI0025BB5D0B|nr:copper resistance CopC family protein [Elioraea sp.]